MTSPIRGLLALAVAATCAITAPVSEPRVDLYGDPLPAGALARLGTLRLRQPSRPGGVAFSPDGKRVAVWGDGRLVVIDVATGRTLFETKFFEATPGAVVLAAQFSANASEITAVAENPPFAVAWRLAPEKRKLFAVKLERGVTAAALSTDGRTVGIGLHDGSTCLLDAADGKFIRELTGPKDGARGLAYSLDGRMLARAGQKTVGLWNLATGTETRLLETGQDGDPFCAAFSPNGKTLVTGEYFGDVPVRVWDVATGKERYAIQGIPFGCFPRAAAFAPDGRTFIHTGEGGAAFLRDTATGKEVRQFHTGGNTYAAAFSPDGKTLAAAVSQYPAGSETKLFDVDTGRELFDFPRHQLGVDSILVSADGKTIVTSGIDRTVRVWDAATGRPRFTVGKLDIKTIYQRGWPTALSSDGTRLVVARDAEISVWDLATGKELRQLRAPESAVVALAASPTGKAIAVLSVESKAHQDSDVTYHYHAAHILNIETGIAELALGGLSREVTQVKFCAGSRLLALAAPNTSFWDGVTLYDTTDRKSHAFIRSRRVNDPRMSCFDISPDGKLLAAATDKLRFWDTTSGEEKRAINVPDRNGLLAFVFSPNGRYLAASQSGGWCVFDAVTGQVVWERAGRPSGPRGVAFSPDGARLATGCEDGTAMVWELPAEIARP